MVYTISTFTVSAIIYRQVSKIFAACHREQKSSQLQPLDGASMLYIPIGHGDDVNKLKPRVLVSLVIFPSVSITK